MNKINNVLKFSMISSCSIFLFNLLLCLLIKNFSNLHILNNLLLLFLVIVLIQYKNAFEKYKKESLLNLNILRIFVYNFILLNGLGFLWYIAI